MGKSQVWQDTYDDWTSRGFDHDWSTIRAYEADLRSRTKCFGSIEVVREEGGYEFCVDIFPDYDRMPQSEEFIITEDARALAEWLLRDIQDREVTSDPS